VTGRRGPPPLITTQRPGPDGRSRTKPTPSVRCVRRRGREEGANGRARGSYAHVATWRWLSLSCPTRRPISARHAPEHVRGTGRAEAGPSTEASLDPCKTCRAWTRQRTMIRAVTCLSPASRWDSPCRGAASGRSTYASLQGWWNVAPNTRARSSIIGDEKLKSTRKPDASMLLLAGRSFLIGHLSRPIDLFRFLDHN
jgi:hypothetical protein